MRKKIKRFRLNPISPFVLTTWPFPSILHVYVQVLLAIASDWVKCWG